MSNIQNSGVILIAQLMHVSSSKDKKLVYTKRSHYGVIQDMWELDYVKFRVLILQRKLVKSNNNIWINELRFTLVNLNMEGHEGELFLMAYQTKDVFNIIDLANKKWPMVLHERK